MTTPTSYDYSDRVGPWMGGRGGKRIYYYDYRVEDFNVEDVAHSLSMMCRYNGTCDWFYSVGQHSLLMAYALYDMYPDRPELALQGLLHDVPEAYMADIVTPLKREMPKYTEVEAGIERVIYEMHDLPYPMYQEVKELDRRIIQTEKAYLYVNVNTEDWGYFGELIPYIEPYMYEWPRSEVSRLWKTNYEILVKDYANSRKVRA